MELAIEIVKLATALLGFMTAVVALLSAARGNARKRKSRKR